MSRARHRRAWASPEPVRGWPRTRSHSCAGSQRKDDAMRALIQRVRRSEVRVGDEIVGSIGPGMTVLIGVGDQDSQADATKIARKIEGLRIFKDDAGKINRSIAEMGGAILAISQ